MNKKYEWRLKYDPNQPRVPVGSPEGGQWTSARSPEVQRIYDERAVCCDIDKTTPTGSRRFAELSDDERLEPRNFIPEVEQAIMGYAKRILAASDPESAEMNFSIYQNERSGELRRTVIVPGARGIVQEIYAPNGWRTVGSFHTHPGSSGRRQSPSMGDRRTAAYINIDTGAGVFAIGSWLGGKPTVTYWSTDYPRKRIEGPGELRYL